MKRRGFFFYSAKQHHRMGNRPTNHAKLDSGRIVEYTEWVSDNGCLYHKRPDAPCICGNIQPGGKWDDYVRLGRGVYVSSARKVRRTNHVDRY